MQFTYLQNCVVNSYYTPHEWFVTKCVFHIFREISGITYHFALVVPNTTALAHRVHILANCHCQFLENKDYHFYFTFRLNEEYSPLCSNNSFKQVGSISSSPLSKKTTPINPTTNFKPISTTAQSASISSQSATTFHSASQAADAASSQQSSSSSVIHAVPAVPIEKKESPPDTSKSKQLHRQQPTESPHKTCSTENNDESQVSETGFKTNSQIDDKNTQLQNLDNSDSSDQNMEISDPN